MTMSQNDDRVSVEPRSRKSDIEELTEAAREAELARASFSANLRSASESGRATVRRVVASARPLVVGAMVLGGAAIVVSAVRLARRPRARGWAPPRQPTLLGSLFRTVVTRLVIAGAARAAQHLLQAQNEDAAAASPGPFPLT
jgi:hypothetical protein